MTRLFLSTDAQLEEIETLRQLLQSEQILLNKFSKEEANARYLSDGAVSIIDQVKFT